MAFHLHPAEASHMLYSFYRTSTIVHYVTAGPELPFVCFSLCHMNGKLALRLICKESYMSFFCPSILINKDFAQMHVFCLINIMCLFQKQAICLDTDDKAPLLVLLPRVPPAHKSQTCRNRCNLGDYRASLCCKCT